MTEDARTGWTPGMLQDDSPELSRWLASRVDAMLSSRLALDALIVPAEDAPRIVGIGQTTIDRLEASGEFPKRRVLAKRRVGYLRRELVEWAESRPVSDLLPVRRAGQTSE